MNDHPDGLSNRSGYASPPCFATEVAPDYFDPLAVDPEQARDVARWRKAERARLRAMRQALSSENRESMAAAIRGHLCKVLEHRFNGARGVALSAYWPIKGEPSLLPLMTELHAAGIRIALPVVATRDAPPGTAEVIPDIVLAPVLGWTSDGYRLGYGGGYFDRTLAILKPRPFTIGIGLEAARLATIYPQPHDIALDLILTEAGERTDRVMPGSARWPD